MHTLRPASTKKAPAKRGPFGKLCKIAWSRYSQSERAASSARAMRETGVNLDHRFRETSEGGLAKLYNRRKKQ